jgi:hypothetical protein
MQILWSNHFCMSLEDTLQVPAKMVKCNTSGCDGNVRTNLHKQLKHLSSPHNHKRRPTLSVSLTKQNHRPLEYLPDQLSFMRSSSLTDPTVTNMKELHDERLDIHVLSVCSVVCNVQMIEVIRKESMVTALDPMRLDFILTPTFAFLDVFRLRVRESRGH